MWRLSRSRGKHVPARHTPQADPEQSVEQRGKAPASSDAASAPSPRWKRFSGWIAAAALAPALGVLATGFAHWLIKESGPLLRSVSSSRHLVSPAAVSDDHGHLPTLAVALHPAGQMMAFYLVPGSRLDDKFENVPGGPWFGGSDFGPANADLVSVAAATNPSGDVEVFAVLGDGSIRQNTETAPNGPWVGWQPFAPAGTARSVTVAMHAGGRMEVFAVTPSGELKNRFQTSPGGQWTHSWFGYGPPGVIVTGAAAITNHAGDVEVFAVMGDGSIWQNTETAPNKQWVGFRAFADPEPS